MPHVNLGVLAHVDAGKTTLTERLLFEAGAIDRVGSVDVGDTQTDTLALERRRGITIRSAVVSFATGDTVVNLVDTPGHPDFVAEVERVLDILDGVVLVVSAVEGVQAQTRVLARVLDRLRIPTVVLVNKIDRRGARAGDLLDELRQRLTRTVVPMGAVRGIGTAAATVTSAGSGVPLTPDAIEALAEHDDGLLAASAAGARVPPRRLRQVLADLTSRCLVHPVFFGSARTGLPQGSLRRAGSAVVEGVIPAARLDELRRGLPGLTRGEAVLDSAFESYRPVTGEPPARPWIGPDPRHREEYLLAVRQGRRD